MKCRKCGAEVTAEQKRCPKCNAPVLLRVMEAEEKLRLSSKEIREKEKRLKKEHAKFVKEKEKEQQKADKLAAKQQEKEARANEKMRLEEEKRQKAELAREEAERLKAEEQRQKAELERIKKEEAEKAKAQKLAEAEKIRQEKAQLAEQKRIEEEKRQAEKLLAKQTKNSAKKSDKSQNSRKIIYFAIAVIAAIGLVTAAVTLQNNNPADITVTATSSPEPTVSPEPTPTATPEITPTPEPTPIVTQEPTPVPTQKPTSQPTAIPTPKPTPTPRAITRNKILFPSDSMYLTDGDINGLPKYDIELIRNEIFARKGYVFKDKKLKKYFESQAWYTPNPDAVIELNEFEEYNARFLLDYEISQGWM